MVDNRLTAATLPPSSFLRNEGLDWFVKGENEDYLVPAFFRLSPAEVQALNEAAQHAAQLLKEAALKVARENRWRELGIPDRAIPLLKYSLAHELDDYLIGRFDFAGGIDGLPLKLIEFNADTSSLLPETAIIQEYMSRQSRSPGAPFNDLLPALERRLRSLLSRYRHKQPSLLLSAMGHDEDWLNVETVARAAHAAGFEEVHQVVLEQVIFSPGEGVFIELGRDQFIRFDFWFKFVPWDFIAQEEPELLDLLTEMITRGELVVLNPAWSMLLQSKALLGIAREMAPNDPLLLRTDARPTAFTDGRYVRKPIFGRMGENIALFDGQSKPRAETDGDFSRQPMVYQELTAFNVDMEGHRYQASVFVTDEPCAIAIRRQDDLIIDDDASYVPHVVG